MREGGGDSRGVGENRAKEVEKGEQEQESRVNAAKKFLKFFHSAIGRSRTLHRGEQDSGGSGSSINCENITDCCISLPQRRFFRTFLLLPPTGVPHTVVLIISLYY